VKQKFWRKNDKKKKKFWRKNDILKNGV
jgi:hypothetical protein